MVSCIHFIKTELETFAQRIQENINFRDHRTHRHRPQVRIKTLVPSEPVEAAASASQLQMVVSQTVAARLALPQLLLRSEEFVSVTSCAAAS